MVTNVTSLGRSGLYDWLIQRFTALILGAFMFCILGSFILNPDMSYLQWRAIFDSNIMRIFSIFTVFSLCAHAWVGMWTISTDYLTVALIGKNANSIRLIFQAFCAILTGVYLIWGVQILWGS